MKFAMKFSEKICRNGGSIEYTIIIIFFIMSYLCTGCLINNSLNLHKSSRRKQESGTQKKKTHYHNFKLYFAGKPSVRL